MSKPSVEDDTQKAISSSNGNLKIYLELRISLSLSLSPKPQSQTEIHVVKLNVSTASMLHRSKLWLQCVLIKGRGHAEGSATDYLWTASDENMMGCTTEFIGNRVEASSWDGMCYPAQ